MCGECDYPSSVKVNLITIMELQTNDMAKLRERKKELEQHLLSGEPFKHRRDFYIVHKIFPYELSHYPDTKQLYFSGELVKKK